VDREDPPQILVPVSEDDHTRARKRLRYRNVTLGIAAVLASAWIYKHYTDPIRANESVEAGDRQLRSGRYQQAILDFDQAIGYRPDHAEAIQLRGRAKTALFKPVQALPDFLRYAELRPEDPVAYVDIGRTHLLLEDFKAALEDGEHAVRIGSDIGATYQLRGLALRRFGRLKEALADFQKAVELSPEMAHYFERGATYQELGQHELAIADFTEVIKFDGANAQAYHARSKSYRALGDKARATRDHRKGRLLDGR
jgi:tetratricopeptide (TPR) repeat protein